MIMVICVRENVYQTKCFGRQYLLIDLVPYKFSAHDNSSNNCIISNTNIRYAFGKGKIAS